MVFETVFLKVKFFLDNCKAGAEYFGLILFNGKRCFVEKPSTVAMNKYSYYSYLRLGMNW